MTETTKQDKMRQLSQEQLNTLEYILQGMSDRAVAESVGVARQTVWAWRNEDPLFISELNRRRTEVWQESRERLKALTSRALDAMESTISSNDPKASLDAAKFLLKGTRLFDTDLNIRGPTTPDAVILDRLKREAEAELLSKTDLRSINLYRIDMEVEALARSRMAKAMEDAGI